MTKITLYKYEREPGKITVSPVEPPEGTEYEFMYRLLADMGKDLVNGDIRTDCVDVEIDDVKNWHEEDEIEPEEEDNEHGTTES